MTTNPTRTRLRRTSDIQHKRSIAGVKARARNIAARAAPWRDVGGFTTDGCLGSHSVRLHQSDTFSETYLAITVDGRHRRARSYRGVLRCIAEMVTARQKEHRKEAHEKE